MDAPVKSKDGPELYNGISLEVEQIIISANILRETAKDIVGAFRAKQDIPLKHACEDAAKAAGAIKIMTEHLAGLLTQHINRKVRT